MWQRNTAAFAAKPFWEKEKRFLLRTNVMLTAKLDGLALFAIACAVSYLMSGNSGLYKSQSIVYSKITADTVPDENKN